MQQQRPESPTVTLNWHVSKAFKEGPKQRLSWFESRNHTTQHFHFQALYGCSTSLITQRKYFCFVFLLQIQIPQQTASHFGSFFAKEKQNKAGSRHNHVYISATHNNILPSSQQEIKAVIRSHNEEHISICLSHETHAHTHS